MDSYTDRRNAGCGCRRQMGAGQTFTRDMAIPYAQPEQARQTTQTWQSWNPTQASPYETHPFMQMGPMMMTGDRSCPENGAGALEQQYSLAMAYVPWQQWNTPYPMGQGLEQGTIFQELDLPFNYGRCSR